MRILGYVCFALAACLYMLTAQPGAPVSDDFNGTSLNTSLWTFSAPAGGSVAVSGGHALLSVPGGANHDVFTGGDNAVCILQPVANADFDVAAKFDSVPASQYQGQGILVQQDSGTYLRFEVYSDGRRAYLFAAVISGGSQTTKINTALGTLAAPWWLQVQRSGNNWTLSWSTNGTSYQSGGSFSQTLTLAQIGLYAWNYNSNPASAVALTASVDYFYNLAASGTPVPDLTIAKSHTGTFTQGGTGAYTITVSNIGTAATSGTVTMSDTVPTGLTPSAASGTGWTCGISGQTVTCTQTASLAANSSYGAIALSVNISPTAPSSVTNTATVSGGGETNTSNDSASDQTAIGTAGGGGAPVSDNFDSTVLNTSLWTIENPLGDGTVTMNGTAVTLNIPHGTTHDAGTGANNSVRIVQPVSAANFTVEAQFQSAVNIQDQSEGILVEQDATDFLRFNLYYDGTSVRVFAAQISGQTATVFVNTPITAPNAPLWLRLQRAGSTWTGSWSTDGANYTSISSFTSSLNVQTIGPFAATGTSAPAFTAIVDYFFNTASELTDQSGPKTFTIVTVDPNPPRVLVEKTLADIRGTGKLAVVAGFESPSAGIYWYEQPTSGVLTDPWNKHTIIATGIAYEDMLPLDVNGDGAVDIVASFDATNSGTFSLVWFQNPRGSGGDPATATWVMHTIGAGNGENNMFAADIDGDGKMDLVTGHYIYFQNNPTSWTRVQYNTSDRGIALLDIGSGKGSINLIGTGANAPYNVVWFENPRETGGNARTGTWIMHTIGPSYTCGANNCPDGPDVAVYNAADLNGDGRMDVVVGQSEGLPSPPPPTGGLTWYEAPSDRRNGTWIRHTIDAGFVDAHKIRIADIDQNGTLDLITSEQDQSPLRRVAVFYNDGLGHFTEQVLSNQEGHNTAIGDVTADGDIDILDSGHGYYGAPHPIVLYINRLKP